MGIIESYASRHTVTGKNPSARLMAKGKGYATEPAMRTAWIAWLASNMPDYEGLVLMSTEQEALSGATPGVWSLQADYGLGTNDTGAGTGNNPAAGGSGAANSNDSKDTAGSDLVPPEMSIDISAVTQHITQSLNTVQSLKRSGISGTVPDYKRAIGVSSDFSVTGVDIPVGSLTWDEVWTFSAAFITWDYIKRLRNMVGKWNDGGDGGYDGHFRSFDNGEVQFLGAPSSPQGIDKRKFTFKFKSQPNDTNVDPGVGFATLDEVLGFDYVWYGYGQEKDAGAKKKVSLPQYVFQERVLRGTDFRYLGIGT